MAATVQIHRFTGGGAGSGADITSGSTRMKQADNGTADANNPVPAVTTSYSYWVSTRLVVTAAPDNGINNVKWHSDGVSAGTGLTINVAKASTGANAGYRQAAAADELNQTNHTGLDAAPVDAATRDDGTPITLAGSIGATTGSGTIEFVVYQLAATDAAAPGTTAARTFTWVYDET